MKKLIGTAALLLLAACRDPVPAPDAPAAAAAGGNTDAVLPTGAVAASAAAVGPDEAADDPTAVNQAIDDTLGDHARYQAVILRFQKAVADKDAATVASLVDYPFTATIDGQRIKVADSQEFVRQYGKIVTPAIADAITRQKYSQLMVNYKGVMFGSGEAWVNGICKDNACREFDVRVVAIQPAG